jgi:hypothetical protein
VVILAFLNFFTAYKGIIEKLDKIDTTAGLALYYQQSLINTLTEASHSATRSGKAR